MNTFHFPRIKRLKINVKSKGIKNNYNLILKNESNCLKLLKKDLKIDF